MKKTITVGGKLIRVIGVLAFILLPFYACFCFKPASAYASSASAEKQEVKVLKEQIKSEVKQLKEIESKIHHIKAAQQAKIKNLIPVYSSMSPRKAAAILPGINKSVAIYILSHMTAKTASAVISRMPVKSAIFFTNAIAGK
ncbi:MAG: MotE family protein [Candidatus Acidulodesulfobacterium sp.]